MTEHTEENIGDDDFPIFTTNLNHLIDRGYSRGYAAALDDVEVAVYKVKLRPVVAGPLMFRRGDVLFAIDALREELDAFSQVVELESN